MAAREGRLKAATDGNAIESEADVRAVLETSVAMGLPRLAEAGFF